jgi:hypothetical protein
LKRSDVTKPTKTRRSNEGPIGYGCEEERRYEELIYMVSDPSRRRPMTTLVSGNAEAP